MLRCSVPLAVLQFRAPNLRVLACCLVVLCAAQPAVAQQSRRDESRPPVEPKVGEPSNQKSAEWQAELDAAFVKMLSGATLEGSFTSTGPGKDPTKLSREKYTIGVVQKIAGPLWLIPSRIQYGEHDVTLPIMVPIHWAGDTPVIVVDNVGLPGFGTVSARVMFFADHYAGYWKHGEHGGHLFGVIRREQPPDPPPLPPDDPPRAIGDPSSGDAASSQKPQ